MRLCTRARRWLTLLLLWLGGGVVGLGQVPSPSALSQSQALFELELLDSLLVQAHGGYNRFTTPEAYRALFAQARLDVRAHDSVSMRALYLAVARLVAATREGHAESSYPSSERKALRTEGGFFPFPVRVLPEGLFVLRDTVAERQGAEIVAINGEPASAVLEELFSLVAADGDNRTGNYRWLDGWAFADYYQLRYGPTPTFELTLEVTGRNWSVTFSGLSLPARAALQAGTATLLQENYTRPVEWRVDSTTRSGYLAVHTFGFGAFSLKRLRYRKQLRRAFGLFRRSDVPAVVLDLRRNGGGTEGCEDDLARWVLTRPYRKYSRVSIAPLTYDFRSFQGVTLETNQATVGRWLRREYAPAPGTPRWLRKADYQKQLHPRRKAFGGRLYVLVGGTTYSGAAELASHLKRNRDDIVFVGEEVGGAARGNTSGYDLEVVLPYSQIPITVPLVLYEIAPTAGPGRQEPVAELPERSGIVPDLPALATVADLHAPYDPALAAVDRHLRAHQPTPYSTPATKPPRTRKAVH